MKHYKFYICGQFFVNHSFQSNIIWSNLRTADVFEFNLKRVIANREFVAEELFRKIIIIYIAFFIIAFLLYNQKKINCNKNMKENCFTLYVFYIFY